MGQLTQENRFITITDFSLGKDTFVVSSLQGSEYISGLFEFEVELYSEKLSISPDSIVGKSCTVGIQNEMARQFHGYVSTFSVGEMGPHNHRLYRITVVPWLWFLTKTQNCRIYQDQNTKDIVSSIFGDYGFNDFDFKADGGTKREYCVQYNESDFEFVSRLLEEDGISYFFEHEKSKHTMVLVDKSNAYKEVKETDLEYSKGSHTGNQLSLWEHFYEFKKGSWTLNDYNFLEPKKSLITTANTKSKYANNGKFEHYEYPGLYYPSGGPDLVKIRLEAEESMRDTARGASDCSTFYAGGKFALKKHDTSGEQGQYILVGVHHRVTDSSFFAGKEGQAEYSNNFMCVPADIHFRPTPVHQRPIMKGPQSALVVGPSSEEIYIDELCRIKVQFYWDRINKKNEHSSCYIRVVQSWAGNQWGTSFIPRIGQEVIVNFLDGDPDRPLVTGTVYNEWNKPVYTSKTQSGIKTRSTKGGSAENFNELRFEDLKGSEQIYLHAEKDFDTHVENNQSLTVDVDRTKHVGGNEVYEVSGDREKTIEGKQKEDISGEKITVVGADHTEEVGGSMEIKIKGDLKENVSGKYDETVSGDSTHKANNITLQAQSSITLKTGASKITMSNSGDIKISGVNITIEGSSNVKVKAGASATLQAGGSVTVKGAVVKVN